MENINNLDFMALAFNLKANSEITTKIWNGDLNVKYSDMNNAYGSYTQGADTVLLNSNLIGGGREASAKLAAVLAHEGTHVAGNRYEGVAHIQAGASYDILNSKFNLNGDSDFRQKIIDGIKADESWVENTGDTDWWKLKYSKDSKGNIVHTIDWDGSLDLTVKDIDGKIYYY